MLLRRLLLASAVASGVTLAAAPTVLQAQVTPENANPEHEKIKSQAERAYQAGNFAEAIVLAERVIKLNAKDDVAYYLRGSAKVELGLREMDAKTLREGIADARHAISLGGQDHIDYYLPYLYGMTQLAGMEDKPEHAEVSIQVATQIVALENIPGPQKANMLFQRARAHEMINQLDKALADFEEALKVNPNHVGARLAAGHLYVRQGQLDKAEAHFTKAVETFPNDARVYNDRGTFYQRSGKHELAIQDFTKVIEIDKEAYFGYMNRAFTRIEMGEAKAAETDLDRALSLQPKRPELYSLRGTARLAQGLLGEAQQDYRMVVELDSKNAIARGDLGFAQFFAGDYRGATESFTAAITADERLQHLNPWLYVALAFSGQQTQADARVAKILEKDQAEWKWADRMLAMLTGKISEEELIGSIVGDDERIKNAQRCEAHYFLGQKALKEGRSDAAAEHFKKSLAAETKDLSAYRGSQFALERLEIATRGTRAIR
jgi:lipoprotein NlpI